MAYYLHVIDNNINIFICIALYISFTYEILYECIKFQNNIQVCHYLQFKKIVFYFVENLYKNWILKTIKKPTIQRLKNFIHPI